MLAPSLVTQVFLTPVEIPSNSLCITSGKLMDMAHAFPHLFSIDDDVMIGVPPGHMIASLLLTFTTLARNVSKWATEHSMVG